MEYSFKKMHAHTILITVHGYFEILGSCTPQALF